MKPGETPIEAAARTAQAGCARGRRHEPAHLTRGGPGNGARRTAAGAAGRRTQRHGRDSGPATGARPSLSELRARAVRGAR